MEPAPEANSVFLFTQPSIGSAFGYNYDGMQSDGIYHYTGDGQEGDQSKFRGGNKALLDTVTNGRAVRLFKSAGRLTTYVGEFALADPPFFRADAPDKYGEMRSVLVFRLQPVGSVATAPQAVAGSADPIEMPLEGMTAEEFATSHPEEPSIAVRREAALVLRYAAWLDSRGEPTVRQKIPLPGGGFLYTDIFNTITLELIEAKASGSRTHVRAGLGQLLDYGRFVEHSARALLLPTRPSDDLIELLRVHDVGVIWEEGKRFVRGA